MQRISSGDKRKRKVKDESSESDSYKDEGDVSDDAEAYLCEADDLIRVDRGMAKIDNGYREVELLSDVLHMQGKELSDTIGEAENLCGIQNKPTKKNQLMIDEQKRSEKVKSILRSLKTKSPIERDYEDMIANK